MTTYTYDSLDRLIETSNNDGTVKYAYTTDGKIRSVTDSNGVTTFTYDNMDGLTRVDYPDGTYVGYSYDEACRLTKVSTPFGSTSYEYDVLDRLTRVVDRNGYATVYEYDENGNRTRVTYANGYTTTYDYDLLNRLIRQETIDIDGNFVVKYIYTLGAAGERLKVEELDRTVEYTYDDLYRLTSETITEGDKTTSYTYAYDSVSNRILKTENGKETVYTYNELNQLVSDSDTSYEYDLNGNLIRVIGSAHSALYEYNAKNKLVKATVQNGNVVVEETYTYDYAGNRTSKTTRTSNGKVEYTRYLNDTNSELTNVLCELDETDAAKCVYVIGADLISQERDGKTYAYVYDGHGSVTALANENGRVTDAYVYDAFGNLLKSTGLTENCYRYCGEQFDETTGLYYLRARYMDTSTGRFISQDSYAGSISDPTSLHKYLYANANPVMYCDPSGYLTLAGTSFVQAINAKLDEISTTYVQLGIRVIQSLKDTITVVETEKVLAVAMAPFIVYLEGKLTKIYRDTIVSSTLSKIFTDPEQKGTLLALMLMTSWISDYILSAARENSRDNKSYKYKHAIHHIVPKGLVHAIPSVMVLNAVGISVHEKNYKSAYYNPTVLSFNLVRIKTKTHIAIHSNNYLYCGWVNAIIVPSYLATYNLGTTTCQGVIAGVLTAMGKEIQSIDSLVD